MAGIINVNSDYSLNARRVMTKLSFELGETFMARIVNLDEKSSELLLKLLDGWQFSAKIEKPLDFVPNGLVKFLVEGFDGDQLLIKLVQAKNEEGAQRSSIDKALQDQSLSLGKEDFELLEKMVKNNIPIKRENVASLKTLIEFKNKLELNEGEKDVFINKYLNTKGIDINSDKGRNIKASLDTFIKELQKVDTQDLLTLKENNIEVTDENIKSFNKLFKEPKAIYKSIIEVNKALENEKSLETKPVIDIKDTTEKGNGIGRENENLNKEIKANNLINQSADNKVPNGELKETLNRVIQENSKEVLEKVIKDPINDSMEDPLKGTAKDTLKGNIKDPIKDTLNAYIKDSTKDSIKDPIKDFTKELVKEATKGSIDNKVKNEFSLEDEVEGYIASSEEMDSEENLISKLGKGKVMLGMDKDTSKLIKEQISIKSSELKDIIKSLIEQKANSKPEAYDKFMQSIKANINDFKVFNSVSNQYYYLDMPLNIRNQEYDCKLMIKDDRKKDKGIDSKNVKLVVTVNTGNMGVVDSYIKVNNKSVNIDIKCEEAWVKVLDLGKSKILKGLEESGYLLHINVEKKQEDANITNCTDFFNDGSISSINIRV